MGDGGGGGSAGEVSGKVEAAEEEDVVLPPVRVLTAVQSDAAREVWTMLQLGDDHRIITAPSLYHHCTITAPIR